MSTHNKGFYEEIRKIIFELSSNKLTRKKNTSSMVRLYQQDFRKQLVYSHLKLDIWQE